MGSQDIAADIARRIVAGEWPKGAALPTTDEFAAEYGVYERRIDDAMRILITRGLVVGVRGGRRYVA